MDIEKSLNDKIKLSRKHPYKYLNLHTKAFAAHEGNNSMLTTKIYKINETEELKVMYRDIHTYEIEKWLNFLNNNYIEKTYNYF